MGKIVLLDDLTINQIAAGEVIERPSSVIKEMVENSIDAGATNITVEIRNGGITYIRIIDNGKGIEKDDLEIAFERHATSKIRSSDDLNSVMSMGFRGEALASIASIAKVELISKTANDEIGNKIVVKGGNILEREEIGCQTGTVITVSDLFYNTPVRYKFLKKDFTESGYIEDAIARMALVHPEIAFKFINTGKTVIQTTGNNDFKSVIYSIYGKDVAEGIVEAEYNFEGMMVKGVVGKPEIARSNRSNQLFFVNKRFVKDKTMSSSAEQAFKGLLPIGKFGFLVLNIEMTPEKVDVNVHPAKLEVRFEEESNVFKAVYHTIKESLLKSEMIATTIIEEKEVQEIEEIKAESIENKVEKPEKHETEKHGFFASRLLNRDRNKQIQANIEKDLKNENIIEKLYEERESSNKEKTEIVSENNFSDINTTSITSDYLQKLKMLQQQIKTEVENNPSIKLTDSYMNLEQSLEKEEQKVVEELKVTEEENSSENTKVSEDTTMFSFNPGETVIFNTTITTDAIDEPKKDLDKTQVIDTEAIRRKIEEKNKELETKLAEIEKVEKEYIRPKTLTENEDNTRKSFESFEDMYTRAFGKKPIDEEEKAKEEARKAEEQRIKAMDIIKDDSNVSIFEGREEYTKPTYKFVGIVFKTYIIIEINSEMYIIDQHAAHERIMYERVKQNYYSEETKDSQLLLLPDIITLTHKEMEIAKDNIKMFEQAGFTVEEFGENTIRLSGVPEMCVDLDTKELFLETLDEINTVARTAKQEIEEKFIATVACKAAVKANMILDPKEVESLMDNLLQLPNPFTCPHGRPTAIKMSKYDIEKKFSRR